MAIHKFHPREAAIILNKSERTIQVYCQKYDVKKVFNRYQITQHHLYDWGASKQDVLDYISHRDEQAAENDVRNDSQYYAEAFDEVDSQDEQVITQEFTEDQYNKLQNIILDYERIKKELSDTEQRFKDHIADLRNERDYLRNSLDKTSEQLQKVFDIMQQRNFIEAKDKGLDD